MKSFRFIALAFAAACAVACVSAVHTVHQVLSVAGRWIKGVVLDGFKLAARSVASDRKPTVLIVRAKAFVLNLAQRKRPEFSNSWRMCTST